MYHGTTNEFDTADEATGDERRPTIALMGEFSAGKTTLINFLLGDDILPTRVTATQLPPVWMSYGERSAFFVDDEGNENEVAIEDLGTVGVEGVRYIRLFADTGILSELDLIDTPGISDPNIPISFRDFVAEKADALLWCTHSTQAWRESERSTLDAMPVELLKHSVLLATRSDKLTPQDRARVRERLVRETDGRFANIIMFSALDAIEATSQGEAGDLWRTSGGEELLETLHRLSVVATDPDAPRSEAIARPGRPEGDVLMLGTPVTTEETAAPVVPRRVRRIEPETSAATDAMDVMDEVPAILSGAFAEEDDPETSRGIVEENAIDGAEDSFAEGAETLEEGGDHDQTEAEVSDKGSLELIEAVSMLATGSATEPEELRAEPKPETPVEIEEQAASDENVAETAVLDTEDRPEEAAVTATADISGILDRARERPLDDDTATDKAPEPEEGDLVAKWQAFHDERAPETRDALQAAIVEFLKALEEEQFVPAGEKEPDGWRLYV